MPVITEDESMPVTSTVVREMHRHPMGCPHSSGY